ncbi:hypothetical protein L208DRAFT_1412561 [Tricholoma matsutake]|nr:hypothetical protein L208DRAFT_1412561 [Tricholoma matsutake 945]
MLDKVDLIDDKDLLYDPDAKGQLGRIISHRGKEHNGRVHYCLFRCYPLGLHHRDDVKRQIIGGFLSFFLLILIAYTFLCRPDTHPLPNAQSN